jgi:surfactin synthase thioesterase subunit
LRPDIDVCAVMPRGLRAHDDPVPASVASLADALVSTLRAVTDRPFALFGHSLGAAIAYEVAVRLVRVGHVPIHLIVAARGAPDTVPPGPGLSDLDDESFVSGLRSKYDAIPAAILEDRELLELFLPQLRSDVRLHEQYVAPCVPLPCPITVLSGRDDETVREADLDAWASFTRASFKRLALPGGHFFVHDARNETLAAIAGVLRAETAVHE